LRKIFFLILALLLLAGPAAAYDVLVVQSQRGAAFDEMVKGFRSACAASSRVLVVTDYAEPDMARVVREDRPRVVVAIGDAALDTLKKVRQTPVVSLLSLSLRSQAANRANLTGVDLLVPPERFIPIFKALKVKRIGILHDPSKSGPYLKRARSAAGEAGLDLKVSELSAQKQVVGRLLDLVGKVDALWMIPDTTAVGMESMKAYFLFSMQQMVPVVSFADTYLGMGAAAVLEIDWKTLGRQAGEMAEQVLGGTPVDQLPVASPRKAVLKANRAVLRNLGLREDLLDHEGHAGE
jgi:ABC-type uncharacterized transport system substrate-binding protein